jgi:hypothetical protein
MSSHQPKMRQQSTCSSAHVRDCCDVLDTHPATTRLPGRVRLRQVQLLAKLNQFTAAPPHCCHYMKEAVMLQLLNPAAILLHQLPLLPLPLLLLLAALCVVCSYLCGQRRLLSSPGRHAQWTWSAGVAHPWPHPAGRHETTHHAYVNTSCGNWHHAVCVVGAASSLVHTAQAAACLAYGS